MGSNTEEIMTPAEFCSIFGMLVLIYSRQGNVRKIDPVTAMAGSMLLISALALAFMDIIRWTDLWKLLN
jgi:hypothetical protein